MEANQLLDEINRHHLRALWAGVGLSDEPRADEAAFHWSWKLLQSFGDRAADEISMQDAERRVLILTNPAFGGRPVSTGTLIAAVQVLNPREIAEPHRHTISALRLITAEDGGITTVNGIKCPMVAGDLILTPAWCWHGHYNDTDRRLMWVDVLDLPLIGSLDGIFFEHPSDRSPKLAEAKAFADAAWSGAGIVQSGWTWDAPYSPKLRYPWADAKLALDAMPANEDGSREIRYTNPLNNGPVMPTIDCYAVRLESGQPTQRRRSTASTICHVVEGGGRSVIGDKTIDWSRNDIFTVPNWQWVSHTSHEDVSYLAQVTNRDMLRKIALLREETDSSI